MKVCKVFPCRKLAVTCYLRTCSIHPLLVLLVCVIRHIHLYLHWKERGLILMRCAGEKLSISLDSWSLNCQVMQGVVARKPGDSAVVGKGLFSCYIRKTKKVIFVPLMADTIKLYPSCSGGIQFRAIGCPWCIPHTQSTTNTIPCYIWALHLYISGILSSLVKGCWFPS